ncbi:hypothetical protein DID96_25850 [Burkholderia sp. Bp8963]|nr:hypothetical protein DID96_25850 [Burkholderia sp. Bp8963]
MSGRWRNRERSLRFAPIAPSARASAGQFAWPSRRAGTPCNRAERRACYPFRAQGPISGSHPILVSGIPRRTYTGNDRTSPFQRHSLFASAAFQTMVDVRPSSLDQRDSSGKPVKIDSCYA